jgi:single-strand DNA-binding protein
VVSNHSFEGNVAPDEVATQFMSEKEGPAPDVPTLRVSKRKRNGHSPEDRAVRIVDQPMTQPASTTNAAQSEADESTVQEGSDINKVVLAGRLGRDAEIKQTKDGRAVTNFSVGIDDSYKDRAGEWQKNTVWHRVQVWGEVAETVSPGLKKGARVYVEGKLIHCRWVDKQSKKRMSTEVVASDVRFLNAAPKKGSSAGADPVDLLTAAME